MPTYKNIKIKSLEVSVQTIITTYIYLYRYVQLVSNIFLQAPTSMRSVLLAAWFLTMGIGNIVVVIVAEAGSQMGMVT